MFVERNMKNTSTAIISEPINTMSVDKYCGNVELSDGRWVNSVATLSLLASGAVQRSASDRRARRRSLVVKRMGLVALANMYPVARYATLCGCRSYDDSVDNVAEDKHCDPSEQR